MRLYRLPVLVLVLIPLSFVYGQTRQERSQFVQTALGRISNAIGSRQAELDKQAQGLRAVAAQAQQKLEASVMEKARAQWSIAAYDNYREQSDNMTSATGGNKDLHQQLAQGADTARKNLPALEEKEKKAMLEAAAAENKASQNERELVNARMRAEAVEAELKSLEATWRAQFEDAEFTRLVRAIKVAANEYAVRSTANITSQNSGGVETTGARVRFQGEDERLDGATPRYSGATGCTEENLDVGYYFFWTERNLMPTSDKNYKKLIVNPVETVKLIEE